MTFGSQPGAWLHHIEIAAGDPDRLAGFYARVLKMTLAGVGDGILCRGPQRKLLFTRGASRRAGRIGFAFDSAAELAAYRDRLESAGASLAAVRDPLFGEAAFAVDDPDGNTLVFGVGAREPASATEAPDARLQHVALRSTALGPMIDHYGHTLGFFIADRVEDPTGDPRTCFFASDAEHHAVAVFKADEPALDHHSYEVADWNQIRDWADHFASLDLPLRWGPGRHGPGNNLFLFVEDPEGNWIELSAELEVMSTGRETAVWPHVRRTFNLWGSAIMRS